MKLSFKYLHLITLNTNSFTPKIKSSHTVKGKKERSKQNMQFLYLIQQRSV